MFAARLQHAEPGNFALILKTNGMLVSIRILAAHFQGFLGAATRVR
jgi:hypothetical protein